MSLPVSEYIADTGLPNAMVAVVPAVEPGYTERMAYHACEYMRLLVPKVTGRMSQGLRPISGLGWFGVTWDMPYTLSQERGTRPRVMKELAGKTIPMWVDDPTGDEARKIPVKERNRRVRRTQDGRQQVLIFRKAAPIGSRKWVMRRGRMVNVPRSYPGAPGRQGFRNAMGIWERGFAGGVRWRHPGIRAGNYAMEALTTTAREARVQITQIRLERVGR